MMLASLAVFGPWSLVFGTRALRAPCEERGLEGRGLADGCWLTADGGARSAP